MLNNNNNSSSNDSDSKIQQNDIESNNNNNRVVVVSKSYFDNITCKSCKIKIADDSTRYFKCELCASIMCSGCYETTKSSLSFPELTNSNSNSTKTKNKKKPKSPLTKTTSSLTSSYNNKQTTTSQGCYINITNQIRGKTYTLRICSICNNYPDFNDCDDESKIQRIPLKKYTKSLNLSQLYTLNRESQKLLSSSNRQEYMKALRNNKQNNFTNAVTSDLKDWKEVNFFYILINS
jgi:hypothetical protein